MQSGQNVLGEVHSESLQDLLSYIRPQKFPIVTGDSGTQLGIDGTMLASLTSGDVLEIQGPSSSGKTHLLYYFLISCLLPPVYNAQPLHGWGKSGIVYDTDGSFDVNRLKHILVSRITQSLASDSRGALPAALQILVESCLKRLHVFRPASSLQLATNIRALPYYHARCMAEEEIGLVAVDSISSFYWSDRFAAEEFRAVPLTVEHSDGKKTTKKSDTIPLHAILLSLQRIRISHRPIIAYTNWALNPATDTNVTSNSNFNPFDTGSSNTKATAMENMAYKQHLHYLSPHISSILPLTYHITLPMAPFHPHSARSSRHSRILPQISMDTNTRSESGDEILCLVRTPDRAEIERFLFSISDNDVAL